MTIESDNDLNGLRRAGRVVALAIETMKAALEPGMTTAELDAVGAEVYERYGARSAPQLVYGFPGVNLISVNDEAVHGVPGGRVIQRGDLVKIDVTAEIGGYVADAAVTVALPCGPEVHEELRDCAELAFARAASVARTGRPVQDRPRRRDHREQARFHGPRRPERSRGWQEHPRASHDTQPVRPEVELTADRGACRYHRADHRLRVGENRRGPGRLDHQNGRW